jgi:hypothetical protein
MALPGRREPDVPWTSHHIRTEAAKEKEEMACPTAEQHPGMT